MCSPPTSLALLRSDSTRLNGCRGIESLRPDARGIAVMFSGLAELLVRAARSPIDPRRRNGGGKASAVREALAGARTRHWARDCELCAPRRRPGRPGAGHRPRAV